MWALLGQPETPSSQGTLVPGMTPLGDDPFSLAENLPGMRLLLAHSAVLLFGKRPSFSLFPCHTLHRTCCASEEFREGIWGLVVFFCTHPFPQNTQKVDYITEVPLCPSFSSSWGFRKQSHAVASCSISQAHCREVSRLD